MPETATTSKMQENGVKRQVKFTYIIWVKFHSEVVIACIRFKARNLGWRTQLLVFELQCTWHNQKRNSRSSQFI